MATPTREDRDRLKAVLAGLDRTDETLTYGEVLGFLHAVVSAPDLVPPSDWIPTVFGDEVPDLGTKDEAEAIFAILVALYDEVVERVLAGRVGMPVDCRFLPDLLANLDEDAPLAEWSRGFYIGNDWLEESWSDLDEEEDAEMGWLLMILYFWGSREIAESLVAESMPVGSTVESVAAQFRPLVPQAMSDFSALGWKVAEQRQNLPPGAGQFDA